MYALNRPSHAKMTTPELFIFMVIAPDNTRTDYVKQCISYEARSSNWATGAKILYFGMERMIKNRKVKTVLYGTVYI